MRNEHCMEVVTPPADGILGKPSAAQRRIPDSRRPWMTSRGLGDASCRWALHDGADKSRTLRRP